MRRLCLLCLLLTAFAVPAFAQVPLGATAPAYTKTLLGGGTLTNTTHSGKVVVMFLLGYG